MPAPGSGTSFCATSNARGCWSTSSSSTQFPAARPCATTWRFAASFELYDAKMAARDEIVVLNKVDLPATRKRLPAIKKLFLRRGLKLYGISAATGEGLPEVLEAAWKALAKARQKQS